MVPAVSPSNDCDGDGDALLGEIYLAVVSTAVAGSVVNYLGPPEDEAWGRRSHRRSA